MSYEYIPGLGALAPSIFEEGRLKQEATPCEQVKNGNIVWATTEGTKIDYSDVEEWLKEQECVPTSLIRKTTGIIPGCVKECKPQTIKQQAWCCPKEEEIPEKKLLAEKVLEVIAPVKITEEPEKAEPIIRPIIEPLVKPVEKPIVEAVVKSIIEPIAKLVEKPVVEPVLKPVVKPIEKPIAKPVAKPVIRTVIKPIIRPIAKPAVAPAPRPVIKRVLPKPVPAPLPVPEVPIAPTVPMIPPEVPVPVSIPAPSAIEVLTSWFKDNWLHFAGGFILGFGGGYMLDRHFLKK